MDCFKCHKKIKQAHDGFTYYVLIKAYLKGELALFTLYMCHKCYKKTIIFIPTDHAYYGEWNCWHCGETRIREKVYIRLDDKVRDKRVSNDMNFCIDCFCKYIIDKEFKKIILSIVNYEKKQKFK